MYELTTSETAELKRLKGELVGVRAQLMMPPETPAEARAFDRATARHDSIYPRIAELESKQRGAELATRQAKDRLVGDMAQIQSQAGEAIGELYSTQSDALKKALSTTASPTKAAAIAKKQMELAALSRDKIILKSMRRMGEVSRLLEKELTLSTFSGKEVGQLRAMGFQFGGGVDPKIVSGLWKGVEGAGGFQPFLAAWDAKYTTELAQTVKGLVSLGQDSRRSLAALRAGGFPDAKMSKWVRNLRDQARKTVKGVPGAREKYDALVRQTQGYLEMRKSGDLGTASSGRRYLQQLDKAVREANEEGINRASEYWVERKSKYNATTTMRSATNETLRAENHARWEKLPYVYAVRRELAARHPTPDQCDGIASADPLGLGAGVYKVGEIPDEHISGLCRDIPMMDKDFIAKGGRPLEYSTPKGYSQLVKDLGEGGRIAKHMNAAGPKMKSGDMEKYLKGQGAAKSKPVKMKRGEPVAGASPPKPKPKRKKK